MRSSTPAGRRLSLSALLEGTRPRVRTPSLPSIPFPCLPCPGYGRKRYSKKLGNPHLREDEEEASKTRLSELSNSEGGSKI